MAPLIVLLAGFGIAAVILQFRGRPLNLAGRIAAALMFVFTGVSHFFFTAPLVEMVPPRQARDRVMSASRHWIWLPLVVAFAGCATAPDGEAEVASPQVVEVRMTTALGEIGVELYRDQAPLTVANFLRHVDEDAFEGAAFYRTVTLDNDKGSPRIEVIQGGLMVDEGPFPAIEHETTAETGLRHVDGALSMARAEVGTAASEFFICIGDQPALDFGGTRNTDGQGFAVFGRVVDGMDVVRRIHGQPADGPSDSEYMQNQMLDPTVEIRSIRRVL